MKKCRINAAILMAAILGLVGASNASSGTTAVKAPSAHAAVHSAVTLHPLVPGGLPQNNAAQALAIVKSRADIDAGLGATLARNTGTTAYNAADYQTLGYSNGAPPGSVNTGVSDSGTLYSSRDTANCNVRSKMLVVFNIHTQVKTFICVHCANPRLWSQTPPAFHPFTKGTVVPYNKHVFATKTVTCPSGQVVTVNVDTWVRGVLRVKAWGQVSGMLKLRLKAAFDAQVRTKINIKCGTPTPGCGCLPQTPQFIKQWIGSDGSNRTYVMSGENIPFTVFDNGRVYHITVNPGSPFSVPGVMNGDNAQFCEDPAYMGIHNVGLVDPATGNLVGCSTYNGVHGLVTITNRERGSCSVNCSPPPLPPTKNGTQGPGNGTPGSPGGGSPGTGPGPGTGQICFLPDGSVGYRDQFGYCQPNP